MLARDAAHSRRSNPMPVAATLLAALAAGAIAAAAQEPSRMITAAMVPMGQVGPRPRGVDLKGYARVIRVAPDGPHRTVAGALAAVEDASPKDRSAILVAAGTYHESHIQMRPYVDLYGGFAAGDWEARDVYRQATILDARKEGAVILWADHARIDGFVITGGQQGAHGGGIVCNGASPTIINNIIAGNRTLGPVIAGGLGKQVAHEGAGIALLSGSQAYVSNNLICDNSTEVGAGAGLTARGKVGGKILRNVFCNNVAGAKDDAMFHGRVGSRSSPGGAFACSEGSSPQISFNCIVLNSAPINNDAGASGRRAIRCRRSITTGPWATPPATTGAGSTSWRISTMPKPASASIPPPPLRELPDAANSYPGGNRTH